MTSTPLVKPSTPELRAHLRCIRTNLTETLELIVDIGTRTEIHGPSQVIETIVEEVGRPIALEEFHLVEATLLHDVTDGTHVGFVLAVGTILILHLYHDDRTTILDGEGSQLLAHLLLKDFHSLHEVRVFLTQFDVFLLQEPPRQTAHLPLRTNVWTRTHDDVHTVLLTETAELSHVIVARKIELAFLLLVDIPEHIEADCIHAQSLAHLDAMFPVGTRDTRIMQLGSLHHERFTIQEECLITCGKSSTFFGGHHLGRSECQERGKSQGLDCF